MALKLELKPNERVMLGDCVVTNTDKRTRLVIEGAVPILREKDIMTQAWRTPRPSASISPCSACTRRRIRKIIMRYIFGWCATCSRPRRARGLIIDSINNQILTGDLYKALKEARKLIALRKGTARPCTTPATLTRRPP